GGVYPGAAGNGVPDVRVLDFPGAGDVERDGGGNVPRGADGAELERDDSGNVYQVDRGDGDHVSADEVRGDDHGKDLRGGAGRQPLAAGELAAKVGVGGGAVENDVLRDAVDDRVPGERDPLHELARVGDARVRDFIAFV